MPAFHRAGIALGVIDMMVETITSNNTKMKKIVRIIIFMVVLLPFALGTQSFTIPNPTFAPQGTVISLTNITALDYYYIDPPPGTVIYNTDREVKIEFWGAEYSSGQEQWDDNTPWTEVNFGPTESLILDDFYYQDGRVVVYVREDSESNWEYQGDMFMSSSNCTMLGDKVLTFTVNCMYLSNP